MNEVKAKIDHLAKARAAWGDPPPDWIIALAEACNATTQSAVGKRIGYSGSTVSQVLSDTYRNGDMVRIESVIRGALMAENVHCPILQSIGRDVCLNWQKRPFSTANANAVRMFQACRNNCPNSRLAPIGDGQ